MALQLSGHLLPSAVRCLASDWTVVISRLSLAFAPRNGTAIDPNSSATEVNWFQLVYGMKGVVPSSTYKKMIGLKWLGHDTPTRFIGASIHHHHHQDPTLMPRYLRAQVSINRALRGRSGRPRP